MEDYLVRALCFDGEVRAFGIRATTSVSEAQRRHDTWSASSAALGRALVGTAMLGAMLKRDDRLTVKIQGDGPSGAIVVDGDAKGNVKGYIQNPHVSLDLNEKGKIDVRGAVGTAGFLSVTKDLGLKEPFTGQVPLVSGELGEDFTYYLANSEQTPSAVGLSVLVDTDESIKAAGGFMLQLMPGATEATIEQLERSLGDIPLVSKLLDEGETPEEILIRIVGEENIEFLDTMPVQFKCDCSKDKFATAMLTIGTVELQKMIDEDHGAEVVCHFCGEKYYFSEEDLEELIKEVEEQKNDKNK